jgi:hypothetical protein
MLITDLSFPTVAAQILFNLLNSPKEKRKKWKKTTFTMSYRQDESSDSISLTLRKWYETKQEIDRLEKLVQKYKTIVTKEMNETEKDKVSSPDYIVTRRRQTKTYLSKETVPLEVWNRYSVRTSYDVLTIQKMENVKDKLAKKDKKKKRKSV